MIERAIKPVIKDLLTRFPAVWASRALAKSAKPRWPLSLASELKESSIYIDLGTAVGPGENCRIQNSISGQHEESLVILDEIQSSNPASSRRFGALLIEDAAKGNRRGQFFCS